MTKVYPIDEIFPVLKQTLSLKNSVVLQAPPGAGKTTRIPIALLDVILPEKGRIIMLEPRRIAAVSAARWMAASRGEKAGETIGYSIRFESRVSKATRIEVVTEGILTRRIQNDPGLDNVAMVIFDEFHERSLHADLALALCLDVQRGLREDLKILVMSATLDCGPVAALLGDAPVIKSAGMAFPVEERYVELKKDGSLREKIVSAVSVALNKTSGDILVFLPGAGEIRACTEALRSMPELSKDNVTVHPLYGDLSFEEQESAILPSDRRKIVLATNIAETSLTIEGVQVVIDSGLTRRLQYDPSTGMNRLVTVTVSRASAEQRKGRAGRLGPGVCYRLYGRQTMQAMMAFAPPEILISDLSSLMLELLVWGVKDPLELLWLDPPPATALYSAGKLLLDLGAIDQKGAVTETGKAMARLPLHPRLSRLLIRADELGSIELGADLAALISERDIIRRNLYGQSEEPDIIERVEILRAWRREKRTPSSVDALALRAADRTAQQLMRIMRKTGAGRQSEVPDDEVVSRLLLCAFPDRVAIRREEGEGRYLLCQGRGVRFNRPGRLARSRYVVALNVDAGEKTEGVIHLAAPVDENLVRQECGSRIEIRRRVEWDKREGRVIATMEEGLGAVLLSIKPFNPTDEEVGPILCDVIRSTADILRFSKEAVQFQGRVNLMKRIFPEEDWPDLTNERLCSSPEKWLMPWLPGIRNTRGIAGLDILPALRAQLTWGKERLLDELAPTHIVVPSGSRVTLDYSIGEVPVLAVKLQEMFGLSDTPTIAAGRVKLLLHLLSPARRPVQITQDLKGFWDSSYQYVRKELKGRYPRHPWPEDPWNAVPTRKASPRKR